MRVRGWCLKRGKDCYVRSVWIGEEGVSEFKCFRFVFDESGTEEV